MGRQDRKGMGATVGGLERATMQGRWPDSRDSRSSGFFQPVGIWCDTVMFKYWSKCSWIDWGQGVVRFSARSSLKSVMGVQLSYCFFCVWQLFVLALDSFPRYRSAGWLATKTNGLYQL